MLIYLDHNSATPLDPRVLEAMLPYFGGQYGNPSNHHSLGRAARLALECARVQIAGLINAMPNQIIFTGSGTEANNLALRGSLETVITGHISVSAVEHISVLAPAHALTKQGWRLNTIAVNNCGQVDCLNLQGQLDADTRLISVMTANNETGVLQDITSISTIARRKGIIFHTDAIQALGKISVDFAGSGVGLMSLSAHKINGPKGVGALVVDKSIPMNAFLVGGGQEHGMRAGTENVAAIVGFGMAAELARVTLDERQAQMRRLRGYLEDQLRMLPQVTIFAEHVERLPNTVLFSMPSHPDSALLARLDQAGIIASSGSACASGALTLSHVLLAMGVAPKLIRNVVRVSLGVDNTRADIDSFIAALWVEVNRFRPWPARSKAIV